MELDNAELIEFSKIVTVLITLAMVVAVVVTIVIVVVATPPGLMEGFNPLPMEGLFFQALVSFVGTGALVLALVTAALFAFADS